MGPSEEERVSFSPKCLANAPAHDFSYLLVHYYLPNEYLTNKRMCQPEILSPFQSDPPLVPVSDDSVQAAQAGINLGSVLDPLSFPSPDWVLPLL